MIIDETIKKIKCDIKSKKKELELLKSELQNWVDYKRNYEKENCAHNWELSLGCMSYSKEGRRMEKFCSKCNNIVDVKVSDQEGNMLFYKEYSLGLTYYNELKSQIVNDKSREVWF